MIKAFLLILDPSPTWEAIGKQQPSVAHVFSLFVLPLMLITAAFEGFFLVKFGQSTGPLDRVIGANLGLVLKYEISQLVLTWLILFGGAALVRNLGESFHSRHSYQASFTTLAYSMSPLFLVRMLDGCPVINTWICFTIGILLSVSLLYRGIPRILRPEPSNALGMYLFLSVFLVIAAGLAHYIETLVLSEQILSRP